MTVPTKNNYMCEGSHIAEIYNWVAENYPFFMQVGRRLSAPIPLIFFFQSRAIRCAYVTG